MNKLSFILLFCFFSFNLHGQAIDTLALKKELNLIYERDQKTRKGDSTQFMEYIDSCNLSQIESLISKYGWLGKSFVGTIGNYTVWLVIQHAELAIQEKYLPMLEKSVSEGESRPGDLALLQDRILMRKEKSQIYGSQVVFGKNGEQVFYQIADEKNVNERRAKVGLEPIEEYAKHFGIDYNPPVK